VQIVEGVIAVTSMLSILFFVLYAIGIFRLPTGQRPSTPAFDRYGDPLPAAPNPGFQETEREEEGGQST
jgi:hypothetical protein